MAISITTIIILNVVSLFVGIVGTFLVVRRGMRSNSACTECKNGIHSKIGSVETAGQTLIKSIESGLRDKIVTAERNTRTIIAGIEKANDDKIILLRGFMSDIHKTQTLVLTEISKVSGKLEGMEKS